MEIQSLTSVDRATVGETRVQARAPRSTAWCRWATPAWWARTTSSARRPDWRAARMLEKNVLLAGQVGVSGHLTIHDRRDRVRAERHWRRRGGGDACVSGSPAFDAREWLRAVTAFPEAAGDAAASEAIGEARGRTGSGAADACRSRGKPMSEMHRTSPALLAYQNARFMESPVARGAAHSVRISGAAGPFPALQGTGHDRVFRLGAA